MESSRERNPAVTEFSISNILQDERRSKSNEEVTTVTYIHDLRGIQNNTMSPTQNTASPQNFVTSCEALPTAFSAGGFITPNYESITG